MSNVEMMISWLPSSEICDLHPIHMSDLHLEDLRSEELSSLLPCENSSLFIQNLSLEGRVTPT